MTLSRLDKLAGCVEPTAPFPQTGWGVEVEAVTGDGDTAVASFAVVLRPELNHFSLEAAIQALAIVALVVIADARCRGILEPIPDLPAPPVDVQWLDASGGGLELLQLKQFARPPVALLAQIPRLQASATFLGESRLWPSLAASMAHEQTRGNCMPVVGNDGGRYRLIVAAPGMGAA